MEDAKIIENRIEIIRKTMESLNKEVGTKHVNEENVETLINNSLNILKKSTLELEKALNKCKLSNQEKRTNNPEKCYYCVTNNKNYKQCNKCGESKSCEKCLLHAKYVVLKYMHRYY
jgi:hypothetical protein